MNMKNKLSIGIIALAAIIVIALIALPLAGCGNGDDPAPETFTVTFNANGGSPTPPVQTVEKGKTADEPQGVTKANNTLDGWYKEEALTTQWIFANGNGVAADTVTANITLWAKWELLEPENKTFPVSFDFTLPGTTTARPGNAVIKDIRTNCGSKNLEEILVKVGNEDKNIIAVIENAIMDAFNVVATSNPYKSRFGNVFGREGGVTIYVENTAALYKMKATDNQTMYFHIDYLTSSPADIQQKVYDAVMAMNASATVYPYIAAWFDTPKTLTFDKEYSVTITSNDTFTAAEWETLCDDVVTALETKYTSVSNGYKGIMRRVYAEGVTIILDKSPTDYTNYKIGGATLRTMYLNVNSINSIDYAEVANVMESNDPTHENIKG